MATHDYDIANQSGAAFRTDLNNALAAIQSNNSNSSSPATTVAYQWWADTNAAILKIRNSSNNAWINLFTLAGGVDVDAASTFSEDVTFVGSSSSNIILFDKSDDQLGFSDNVKAKFGTGGDLQIYHSGSHSFITDSGTGQLRIQASTFSVENAAGTENLILANENGSVYLYHDNSLRLTTTSAGVTIGGNLDSASGSNFEINAGGQSGTAATVLLRCASENAVVCSPNAAVELYYNNVKTFETRDEAVAAFGDIICDSDTKKFKAGLGGDLTMYHDGSHSYIDNLTGTLYFRTPTNLSFATNNTEDAILCFANGAAQLYFDNAKKFETTTTGTTTTGNGVLTGLVAAAAGLTQVDNAQSLISQASVGSSSTTYFIGNQSIQTSSDRRIKENIVDTEINALSKLKKVKVVDFNWNDPSDKAINNKNARGKWTGCIAQEIVDIFPHAVNAPRPEGKEIDYNSEDLWTIQYEHLVPVLIKAVQELSYKVAVLEAA